MLLHLLELSVCSNFAYENQHKLSRQEVKVQLQLSMALSQTLYWIFVLALLSFLLSMLLLVCRPKITANGFWLGEGGDFHHKCDAEHETPPIVNVLLYAAFLSVIMHSIFCRQWSNSFQLFHSFPYFRFQVYEVYLQFLVCLLLLLQVRKFQERNLDIRLLEQCH